MSSVIQDKLIKLGSLCFLNVLNNFSFSFDAGKYEPINLRFPHVNAYFTPDSVHWVGVGLFLTGGPHTDLYF